MTLRLLMTEPSKPASLSLFEAISEWCDPDLTSEFRSAFDTRFEDQVDALVAASGPDAWKVRRYRELRKAALLQLANLVKNETLIVTAFSALAPLGPAGEISADHWPLLAFDLRDSSARLDGIKLIAIRVGRKDGTVPNQYPTDASVAPRCTPSSIREKPATSVPPDSESVPIATTAARLVINPESKHVTLDGVVVPPTPQPFLLFLLLAEAVRHRSGPISNRTIEKHLWGNTVVAKRAVSDAVRELRNLLTSALGKDFDPHRLVQYQSKFGYCLRLSPDQVVIQTKD
jgi:DNA-binding winged helix-turn-helix (wHTH) protein